jgi:SpoVK/Ycf46/Vps4 family AAA+-type ATPase
LALTISVPSVTLDDLAGAEKLHEDIDAMLQLEEMKIRSITGLFLFGVAGAGKSFFAECFAGTTKRHFAELDLAYFMTLPNPTRAIDNLFHFLLSQNEKYLLLIDEIEKMFQFDGGASSLASEQIFGKMLTWLAKIYGMQESNLIFVATANRVEKLLANKPEFVRKVRFDRLYFLHYPRVLGSAPAIFDLYFNKEKKHIVRSLKSEYLAHNKGGVVSGKLANIFTAIDNKNLEIDHVLDKLTSLDSFHIPRIVQVTDGVFQDQKITDSRYFIYTPPEIKSLVIDILDFYLNEALEKISKDVENLLMLVESHLELTSIEDVLNEHVLYSNPPMQITASTGIRFQIAQGSNIKQGDRVAPFTEIS